MSASVFRGRFAVDTEQALRALMASLLVRGEREGRLRKRAEEQIEDVVAQVALRTAREREVRPCIVASSLR